jgi:SAM-dependent methyltransferase
VPIGERLLRWLLARFPSRSTIFLAPGGRSATEYEDEVRFGFHRYLGLGPDLYRGSDILDLGSGFGGRTVRFAELEARSVIGVEVRDEMVQLGARFAAERDSTATFDIGSAERIPLPADCVDLVLMNDVMEHVLDPAAALAETARVLRPGGSLIVVFPPYYDLTGGSHLHGYATRVPGLNLLFPTRVLRRAVRADLAAKQIAFDTFFRDVPTDKLFNQNGITVRGFGRIVRSSAFEVDRLWYIGHRDRRLSDRAPARWSLRSAAYRCFELPAQVPFVQEVCCARVCAALRLPAHAAGADRVDTAPADVIARG